LPASPDATDRVGALYRAPLVRALLAAVGVVAVGTAISLVVLWPRGEDPQVQPAGSLATESAEVVALRRIACRTPTAERCTAVTIELRSGPDRGRRSTLRLGETGSDPQLELGDRIRVFRAPAAAGIGAPGADEYSFQDFDRRRPLLWLALAFVALVLVTGRLRGARALVGLALGLAVVVVFIVPAILHGSSPVAVAITGSLAVMLVTIPLAHGLGAKAIAAVLGTTAALLLTAGLAALFTDWAHLTGLVSEETVYLRLNAAQISLQGLLLAGMVIGALGVLDDLTVSQASTVMVLRRSAPELGFRQLVHEALDVGHDHIAATVNTLVLAYAGASLPVLLIFSVGDTPFLDAVNGETVAAQVVAMLVGSIGLIAAVPFTTLLAAALALRVPTSALEDAHAH
jgi:uncharacterized membrane protein